MNLTKIIVKYLISEFWLTKIVIWFTINSKKWLTLIIIMLFIRIYKVNMQEVEEPNIFSYDSFNAFFMRSLRKNSRLINQDPLILVMPADGTLSQFGRIQEMRIFIAKKQYYCLKTLLAGNKWMIEQFCNGSFSTIYLGPGDYHRVHMPCRGILREMLYVPGKLFTVNPLIINKIPKLLTRNERIICLFDTYFGPMIQILVGAAIVGSIETVWEGTIMPPRSKIIKHWYYPQLNDNDPIILLKGEEMGRFKLGSTVINLFNSNYVSLSNHLYIKYITRIGECLAYGIPNV